MSEIRVLARGVSGSDMNPRKGTSWRKGTRKPPTLPVGEGPQPEIAFSMESWHHEADAARRATNGVDRPCPVAGTRRK